MVTSRERDYLWSFYAADPRAKLNLGIRRRLAPLLDNDRRKIELLNGLLMSMNGTPIIYYGDEIGMGDNIYLGDRDGVRTPMQWSPDRNGGFSRADPARLYLPPIMDSVYGYEAVNVEAQSRSPTSLLAWMKRLIASRKLHASFGRGTLEILYPANRKVLVYLRQHEKETILCIANLSRAPQPVEIDLSRFKGRVPVELLGRSPFPKIGDLPYFITLTGYGFYWFLLAEETEAPAWHEPVAPPLPELLTLVVPKRWDSLFSGEARALFERRILPEYLSVQRWYGAKSQPFVSAAVVAAAGLSDRESQWTIALADVTLKDGAQQKYALPLGIAWEQGTDDPLTRLLSSTLARVREGSHLGVLYDCAAEEGFVRAMLSAIRDGRTLPAEPKGAIKFTPGAVFDPAVLDPPPVIAALGAEQSNSSVRVGDSMVLKFYRQIRAGTHPEVEMGRFLTEVAGYRNAPRLLAWMAYQPGDGESAVLGVLHDFVRNQGDGWQWTRGYLDRYLEEAELVSVETTAAATDPHAGYSAFAATLGRRVAELHQALARGGSDPAFRSQPIGARDLAQWKRRVRARAQAAFSGLKAARPRLSGEALERVDMLIARRDRVMKRLDALIPAAVDAVKTRVHGDLHLGQVIVAQDDFYIIDFEGEPLRSLEERRSKDTPLRDVAGMVRSFDYAARARAIDRAHNRPEFLAQLLPLARDWAMQATEAFMGGYRTAIEGCPSWPPDAAAADGLIEFFALEKALYEVAYEAANRPDWLRIPVDGVLDMLESRQKAS
jgi:maltose alpha-D-glucosyltransferase/alpha-amylase